MEQKFWQEKWQANEIGFHQDVPHPLLEKYFPALALPRGDRVFVPLCGKSSDMICLQRQGYRVIGLELSELAVESFFRENKLHASIEDAGDYRLFQAADIELLQGDFFAVSSDVLANISAVFDRAALIALPPEMRVQYVKKMQQICSPGMQILLITLEYEAGMVNPPPFTVKQDEVNELYGSWCDIELLEKAPTEVKGKPCHNLAYKLKVL